MKNRVFVLNFAMLTALLSFFSIPAFSQNLVSGKLVDSDSGEPVSFATVAIYDNSELDKPISSTYSDFDGNFTLKISMSGTYELFIQSIGYDQLRTKVVVDNSSMDLSEIRLKSQSTMLEEIVVKADKEDVQMNPGAMTFNMDNAPGDDLEQVVGNFPGVETDFDGNVSIRGAMVTFLVNGEDSGMENPMQEIPKESIERIEMMTNPPVEYASSGPVMNIILKDGAKLGSNIRFGMNMSSPMRARAYVGGTYRKNDKLSFSPWVYHYSGKEEFLTNAQRENFGDRYIAQDQFQSSTNRFTSTGVRANFKPNANNDFTAIFRYAPSSSDRDNEDENIVSDYNEDRTWLYTNSLSNNVNRKKDELRADLRWKKRFFRDGQSFYFRYNWNGFTATQDQNQRSDYDYANPDDNVLLDYRQDKETKNTHHSISTNYKHPLWQDATLTAGGFFNYRITEENSFNRMRTNEGEWVDNPSRDQDATTEYIATDMFVSIKGHWNQWNYSAGTRYKVGSNRVSQWIYGKGVFDNFKSSFSNMNARIQVGYKFDDSENISLTYRTSVRPPSTDQLNPFVDDSDPLNVRMGNPELENTQTHFAELEYLKVMEVTTFKGSLFTRKITNSIGSEQWVSGDTTVTSFINIDGTTIVGLNTYFSANINRLKLTGDASVTFENMPQREEAFNEKQVYYFLKGNAEYKFDNGFKFSIAARYNSSKLTNNTEIQGYGTMDVNVQKMFMDGKLKVYANARDVFDSVEQDGLTQTDDFIRDYYNKRQTKFYTLGFTYYINGI
ncbi:outer membrane beta-barrel protein [Aureibacter tunicatorum]|uniref:Outer membrane protein beta-barrel domain-containing protein n=1 Tax=Aureibacter tunicatorum TaxID=866807 RepID=A0AAE4BTF9_9BACT|nr:outer membrane beta-barrel protein [Aureibacter tunicatorum]MDR6240746.1 hypothetical protein [Aureibacter tunicatorum]